MAHIVEDRVLETSTTTGTGALTLAGAVTGFRTFAAVCAVSDTVHYLIEAVDSNGNPNGDWETGLGTYSGVNTLTRTTVLRSSNANAAVNFAAGTKRVGNAMHRGSVATLNSTGGLATRAVYILTAAHTNTSATTSSTVTDGTTPWTYTFVAGKAYRITVLGTWQTSLATAGVRLSLLGAGGVAGQIGGIAWGAIAQGSVATSLDATLFALGTVATAWPTGSFLLTTAVNPINSPHQFGVNAVFRCTTGGTISIQQAPEVAATSQINIGAVLLVEELS